VEKVVVEAQVPTTARRPKSAACSKEISLWVDGDKREGKEEHGRRIAFSVTIGDLFI